MKRIPAFGITCLFFITVILTGCSEENDSPSSQSIIPTSTAEDTTNMDNIVTITDEPKENVINVYSFTDEAFQIIERYKELHPDFTYEINYVYPGESAYQPFLDEALAADDAAVPDIYCVESAYVLKYTQGDAYQYAAPYKELGIDLDKLLKEADTAQYSVDIGTNPEGQVVGLSYQGTGAAFIYRRSIAKAVWGTDKPDTIKDKIGPGWDKFFEAAADLKAKGYGIVSGDGDIWHSIENSADMPWVVDGKLYIDPKREAFLDLTKLLKDNGYSNNTTDWDNDWYTDMKGTGRQEIFGFFGPAWLVNYVMAETCGGDKPGEGTYGDWAVCEPPVGFFWGGTWVLANKATRYKDAIGDIIEWITLDSSDTGLQYKWANGTLFGPDGIKDAVTSGTVMKRSDGKLDFLGGQDMFDVFYPAGQLVNGKNKTQFDESINYYWRTQVREFTAGNKSKEQAVADFRKDVKYHLDISDD